MTDFENRVPPHNLDAERSVLGSILLDNQAFFDCPDLNSDHFYKEAHRRIYTAAKTLITNSTPVDSVTLIEELRTNNQLEEVGGVAYLVGLSDGVPTSVYAKFYADVVIEKAQLRGIIHAASQAMQRAYDENSPLEIATRAAEQLSKIVDSTSDDSTHSSSDAVNQTLEWIESINQGAVIAGESTGFPDVDAILGGFAPGSLNIIAARPSMGKTAMCINIGENIAARGKRVLMFSLEQPVNQITARRLAAESRVDSTRMKRPANQGGLNQSDLGRLYTAANKITQHDFMVDDRSQASVHDIVARANKLHREQPLDLIVIDYLGLIDSGVDEKRNGVDANRDLGKITKRLKALAKELAIPVILLSQLSRNCENRPDKRPILSDLRDSGSIEQDADTVAFLYRDEYYNPQSAKVGVAEYIIRKNRDGNLGTAELQWHSQHVRFNSLSNALVGQTVGQTGKNLTVSSQPHPNSLSNVLP